MLIEERLNRLGPLPDGGAGLDSPFVDDGVEIVAGDHVSVGGEARVLGPGQVEHPPVGVGPQTAIPVGAGQRRLDPHVGDLADRPWCEPVATGLLPGEDLLLHQGHVPARLGQPVGTGGACRAPSDDQHVVDVTVGGAPGRSRVAPVGGNVGSQIGWGVHAPNRRCHRAATGWPPLRGPAPAGPGPIDVLRQRGAW